jgi:hypothetical protein
MFKRISIWQQLLDILRPSRRLERELRLKAVIRFLMENPDEPVIFP